MPSRALFALLLMLSPALAGEVRADTAASRRLLQRQHSERQEQFAQDVEQLAEFCDESGLVREAQLIRSTAAPIEEQTADVDDLPVQVLPDLPATLPPLERQWRSQLRRLREEYAQDVYMLARRAIRAKHPSLAFHMVREVAFHNPDHPHARQLLGYVRRDDRWVTPYADQMLKRGNVWHEKFGWLPAAHVERYENGQRYYRNQWISADEEASRRRDFRNAWEITTDHFLIRTNHSLERGVELGAALEALYRFVRQEFAAFFNTPQQMQALFDGGRLGSPARSRRHEIHYFHSRQEFLLRLQARQPGLEISNGLYLPADRCSYVFHNPDDPESVEETIFHEVTHQLLSESQRTIPEVARDANFWIVEGIACYMESFEIGDDGRVSIGNPRHPRIVAARHRLLVRNFYVELARYTSMGMAEFRSPKLSDTLSGYYSQAAGLTHFFLHYEDGLYRDALIEHLAQIYSPNARIRANPQSLADLTGVRFSTLDRQYRNYLTEMQSSLEQAAFTRPE